MKKPAFLLLMVCIAQPVLGQSETKASQVEIGFTSGIGVFDLPGSFASRNIPRCIEGCRITDSKPSLDLNIGVKARLKLSNSIRLSSGISYARSS